MLSAEILLGEEFAARLFEPRVTERANADLIFSARYDDITRGGRPTERYVEVRTNPDVLAYVWHWRSGRHTSDAAVWYACDEFLAKNFALHIAAKAHESARDRFDELLRIVRHAGVVDS